MVSGAPKPHALAICSIERVVVSSSLRRLEADGLDVVRGCDTDLGIDDPAEGELQAAAGVHRATSSSDHSVR